MVTLPDSGENMSAHPGRSSSPRAFGIMLSVVLLVVALRPLLDRAAPQWWVIALGFVAFALALLMPRIYAVPTHLWLKLGELLSRIVSPIALAILFFGIFVPFGWVLRMAGRNALRLGYNRNASTYWSPRDPPGPSGESLKHLF
jgi:hypothetical protein